MLVPMVCEHIWRMQWSWGDNRTFHLTKKRASVNEIIKEHNQGCRRKSLNLNCVMMTMMTMKKEMEMEQKVHLQELQGQMQGCDESFLEAFQDVNSKEHQEVFANGDQLSCYNFLDELELEVQVQDCEVLVLVEDGTAAMKGFV